MPSDPAVNAITAATWKRILPFLKPIETLIGDPDISDIMVNGSQAVFYERDGQVLQVPGLQLEERALQVAVRNIARALGDEIDEQHPILDSRLPDGSRVSAVLSPISVGGTVLTIRKFYTKRLGAQELVRIGTLPQSVLDYLRTAIEARRNILIAGGTGTGKTTLLNALAALIPEEERLVVIEDTSEIQVQAKNLVRLEARRENGDLPPVTIRDLLRATLRLRPDRILLGEVRGGEAFDLLQALNTGHSGTISTIHANSAAETLTRFATCVLMSSVDLPHRVVCRNIAEALHIVVHIERRAGKRRVSQVVRVDHYDPQEERYEIQTVHTA